MFPTTEAVTLDLVWSKPEPAARLRAIHSRPLLLRCNLLIHQSSSSLLSLCFSCILLLELSFFSFSNSYHTLAPSHFVLHNPFVLPTLLPSIDYYIRSRSTSHPNQTLSRPGLSPRWLALFSSASVSHFHFLFLQFASVLREWQTFPWFSLPGPAIPVWVWIFACLSFGRHSFSRRSFVCEFLFRLSSSRLVCFRRGFPATRRQHTRPLASHSTLNITSHHHPHHAPRLDPLDIHAGDQTTDNTD